jgi:hypothetical protein
MMNLELSAKGFLKPSSNNLREDSIGTLKITCKAYLMRISYVRGCINSARTCMTKVLMQWGHQLNCNAFKEPTGGNRKY